MANYKKRALSLLMAVMMMLTALPMNAFALDLGDLGTLVCEKEVVAHTAECYVHTEECYHKHSEPVYVLGFQVSGCEYACTEHTHSVENGCPVANCDAHAHSADCGYACGKEEHSHKAYQCYVTVFGKTKWYCSKDEHGHSAECGYNCGISTEHTHDADCYSCTITEHTHNELCERTCGLSTEDIDPVKCNDVTLYLHSIDCKNEEHHTHGAACYLPGDAVREAFYKATGVEIQSAEELAAVVSVLLSCKSGCGYEIVSVLPEFVIEMNLCEEHFCTVCSRLNDGYCTCVELTFANIYNDPANSVTVKVAEGTAAGAVAPHAELTDYEFLGWFDANGSEFDPAVVYTVDTTFTASYRALGEIEKLQNTINFIKNNFDLGTEIGRAITLLSNGEITKEKVLSEKSAAVASVTAALLGSVVTGQITMDQAKEIGELMNQGDEYVVMVAEWLWPENAVEMPTIEEILAGVDFEKLSAEIKDMIAQKYGVEFDENWVENNKALADQYIRECLAEAKSISEQQKAAIMEQIAQQTERAEQILSNIRTKIHNKIADEYANAKDAVKAILADREKGLKIGSFIKKVTGLNAEKASQKNALIQAGLISAIRMSDLTDAQKDGLVALMKDGDNGMTQIINWLFPTYVVNFMADGALVESDVVEHGAMPSFDSAEPTKTADAQYTYDFAGWNAEFAPVTGNVTYTAVFAETVNEYTVTFVNEDGSVLQSTDVAYGEMPAYVGAEPTKAATAQYSYTFNGWTPAVSAVTGNATYTATFSETVNEYTVTFVNEDGSVLQSTDVAYGETPAYVGAVPTKAGNAQYTYLFKGWDAAFAPVTEAVTYTAAYTETVNEYTVTFKNDDGSVLQSGAVAYGQTPVYTGAEPTKAATAQYSYTFNGWTPVIDAVTCEATYTATYTETVNQYTVIVISDGSEIANKTVDYGTVLTADIAPATSMLKEGYDFIGWKDSEGNEVSFPITVEKDMTIEAEWKLQTFTITWKNIDGTVLEVDENVAYGSATEFNGTEPTYNPGDEYNYTFSHFQGTTSKVTEDMTITAAYSKALKEYTVTFLYDGNVIKAVTVQHGKAAAEPVATDMPVVKNHKFDKWDTDFSNVTGDLTVNALYKRTHNDSWKMKIGVGYSGVSGSDSTKGFISLGFNGTIYDAKVFEDFQNWPKSTIMNATDYSSYTVKEGAMDKAVWDGVTYYNETNNDNPTHNDYFQIYKVELVATKGEYHMDNHATFYHTVTFVVDGKEYKVPVEHGKAVALPDGIDLSKEGYTFKGWDVDFAAEGFVVDKSMTITAEFEINKYTVTFWLPTGGKETRVVEHGSLLEEYVPKCPAGQYFMHWYGKNEVKLDYTQPITQNVYFNAKCGWTIEDREVKLFANLNGEEIAMGIAIYEDFYHARKFSDKVLKDDQYDASKIIMPEFESFMFDAAEYAYGKESGASDFYTVEFNELRSWQKGGYTYHYYGEMTLFHTVYFNVNGQLIPVVVEHGAAAEAPVATKDGYTLTWSADFSNVTETMVINAKWIKN